MRFAASFLKGAALRAWNTRQDTLAAEGQQCTLEAFFELLLKQFGGPSVEAACRTQLDKLQQRGRFAVLSTYLAEFERLVGLIDANRKQLMGTRFTGSVQACRPPSTDSSWQPTPTL